MATIIHLPMAFIRPPYAYFPAPYGYAAQPEIGTAIQSYPNSFGLGGSGSSQGWAPSGSNYAIDSQGAHNADVGLTDEELSAIIRDLEPGTVNDDDSSLPIDFDPNVASMPANSEDQQELDSNNDREKRGKKKKKKWYQL